MAVNVDVVYQKVLALANKEQRGYITPQEYNLHANYAQLEIFESYIFELNKRKRLERATQSYNAKAGVEDVDMFLDEKLAIFTTIGTVVSGTTFPANYTIGKIFNSGRVCTETPRNEILSIIESPRHQATLDRNPLFCKSATSGEDIEVYDDGGQCVGTTVTCEVVSTPTARVAWGYNVVASRALYQPSTSTNFALHESEETNLVIKILELSGITINKPGLMQVAGQKDAAETQSKNQ